MAQHEQIGAGMLGRRRRLEIVDQPQLRSGRHRLPREEVVAIQRARILAAVVEVVDSHGYPASVVERIASRAGVSRRTFYEQFTDRDDAFCTAYDVEAERLLGEVRAATAGADALDDAARAALAALLGALADDPAVARLLVAEVLVAGAPALRRRDEHVRRAAALLDAGVRELLGAPLPALTAEGLVGAVGDVIYKRVAAGEAEALGALLDDLHAFCLMQLRPISDVPQS